MPKKPMTKQDVENTRELILDTALDIIIRDGFQNLSLRKIASRLNVTATTIYNYYTNKDEINLMIRIRGFEKLYDLLVKRSAPLKKMEDRLKAMIRAYVEFGLTYPGYYDIMFNLHTPKYLDYVGTDIEPLAFKEKQNALKCLSLFVEPISSYITVKGKRKDQYVLYQVIKFWSDLHGLVTLNNSRLFHEVTDKVEDFIEKRTAEMTDEVLRLKQSLDGGKKLF